MLPISLLAVDSELAYGGLSSCEAIEDSFTAVGI